MFKLDQANFDSLMPLVNKGTAIIEKEAGDVVDADDVQKRVLWLLSVRKAMQEEFVLNHLGSEPHPRSFHGLLATVLKTKDSRIFDLWLAWETYALSSKLMAYRAQLAAITKHYNILWVSNKKARYFKFPHQTETDDANDLYYTFPKHAFPGANQLEYTAVVPDDAINVVNHFVLSVIEGQEQKRERERLEYAAKKAKMLTQN
jgi:hypothetical protein